MASKEADAVKSIFSSARCPRDGVLVVHSAFRSLGQQGYRVESFIEALLDHLRGGTLLMPAMSWRTVNPSSPVFDEIKTESHVGVMAETFRVSYATSRSLHPTHSVSGIGPAASTVLSRHHVDDTPVSANSPYGLLRDYEAYILMLGVDLERVTAIHHAEEVIAPHLYLHPSCEAETYECRDRRGETFMVRLRRHYRLNRNFSQFEPALAVQGHLLRGAIGPIPWMMVGLRPLLREVFSALIRKPDIMLCKNF